MIQLELSRFEENRTIEKQSDRSGKKRKILTDEFIKQNRISLDLTYLFDSPGESPISKMDIDAIIPDVLEANRKLINDEGNIFDNEVPMTGWQNLPEEITARHFEEIIEVTDKLSQKIDAFVSIGIGGSYLGIEATVRALTHNYFNRLSRVERGGAPEIYFLGQNMDPDYFRDTLDMLRGKRVGVNVISKSGTTIEPAIAFRIIQQLLEDSLGDQVRDYIIVTTDGSKGALKSLADKKGYRTFAIPDNIGGRFSVLSDVGLIGLAMANIDIREFNEGFRIMRNITLKDDFWKNPSLVHAAVRHAAWLKRKKIEVIATNSNSLYYVARWMEQLFPESEGHDGHGMWVSPTLYSEKLHANGQMIQQGERNIFETFLLLVEHDNRISIPRDADDLDGLNFLSDQGFDMNFVNRKVIEGPAHAHYLGGVPNIIIEIPGRNAFNLGQLYYMMERSVAISGYLFMHNPFIQPGVEDYKKAMFALIGKPGYEEKAKEISEAVNKLSRIKVDT